MLGNHRAGKVLHGAIVGLEAISRLRDIEAQRFGLNVFERAAMRFKFLLHAADERQLCLALRPKTLDLDGLCLDGLLKLQHHSVRILRLEALSILRVCRHGLVYLVHNAAGLSDSVVRRNHNPGHVFQPFHGGPNLRCLCRARAVGLREQLTAKFRKPLAQCAGLLRLLRNHVPDHFHQWILRYGLRSKSTAREDVHKLCRLLRLVQSVRNRVREHVVSFGVCAQLRIERFRLRPTT
mmetsp:Transcript_11603/g.31070  ORF Transcript_11603/g.31070 Transcript_11603/m.31070 type:complete len:237 (+) Transcript_11603:616-1326(+)